MLYVTAFSIGAALLAAILTVLAGKPRRLLGAAVFAGVSDFVVLVVVYFFGLPLFTHFLADGYYIYTFISISCVTVSLVVMSVSSSRYDSVLMNGKMVGVAVGAWILVICGLWAVNQFIPPGFCNLEGHRELANIWKLEDAKDPLHAQEIDPELKIQVSPEMAKVRAGNKMPADLGSYLEVSDNAALQIVAGHPYYVVGLRVRSGQWSAFEKNGAIIPGYFIVDALDKDLEAKFVSGQKMKIVESGKFLFGWELERYSYFEFFESKGYHFSDLTSLELDEDGKPYYTATLLEPKIGHTGYAVAGTMILDPETGEIQEYGVDEMPTWLDDIWTKDIVSQYASWWGRYANGTVCNWWDASGKRQIDRVTDVFTSDGRLWYQITMTSMGKDTAISEIIYANPTDGTTSRFDVSSEGFPTIEFVDETMFEEVSRRINPLGFEATEVEIDWINGEWVYYGILLGRDDKGGVTGSFNGFAFVRATDASQGDISAVVISGNIADALRQLKVKSQAKKVDISSTSELTQVRGKVTRVYQLDYGDSVVVRMLVDGRAITTTSSSLTSTYAIQMAALEKDGVASHLILGDEVVVTASKGEVDIWWSATHITIIGDPVFGKKED